MHRTSHYLAFDLGAESGRAMVGQFDGNALSLSTVHRFGNGPVRVLGSLYWDVLRLFDEIMQGLSAYRKQVSRQVEGIGLDTWGVDFALLGRHDTLMGNPHHYRDPRTEGMYEAAFARIPRQKVFERTGIQFMQINTLFQLLSMKLKGDPTLEQAQTLLMIPDLLNFWLTGIKASEFSIATTSQCYDPRQGDWSGALLQSLDLPTHIFQQVIPSGTVIGPLLPEVAESVGLEGDELVIAPACHDTGSAVAAVPATGSDFVYLSSGTWSLMGVEIDAPIITEDSLNFNFTNEGGVCGTYRLLKNIMGLWLVQECRRTWAQEGQELSYNELTELAAQAPAFGPLVEPDSHDFLLPGDMPARIAQFCARTGQAVPQSKGEIVRCALESLALKYRWVLEKLEIMLGRPLGTIHIVGGGSQNTLLCQFAADATGHAVMAGPIEATAAGNILMQMLARGRISSLAQGREVIRNSFETISYEPRPHEGWAEAYQRFLAIRQQVPEV
jgi:rhamnulokinase